MNFTIYALRDPRTEEMRYVGATRNLEKRMQAHLRPSHLAKQSPKSAWLRELVSLGLKPEVAELESATEETWKEREVFWIDHCRTAGNDLLNVNPGGVGGPRAVGRKLTPEQRWAISERLKGHPVSEKVRQRFSEIGKRYGGSGKLVFDDSELKRLYVDERVNANDMAKRLGVSPPAVLRRLKELGVMRSPEEVLKLRSEQHRKTHCRQGHPYNEENTKINIRGERVCRTCQRASWQRQEAKRKSRSK